jgi:nitroreductase
MVNYDQLLDLVKRNRSYRRFNEKVRIPDEQIRRWIELARNSASGRNMQPLEICHLQSSTDSGTDFEHVAWAGYLKEWSGPAEGERPVAYVAVLKDKSLVRTSIAMTALQYKRSCSEQSAMVSVDVSSVPIINRK